MTFLGFDGTYFRPVKTDAAGELQVDVVHDGSYWLTVHKFDQVIAAGATATLQVSTEGYGRIVDIMLRVLGADIAASDSNVMVQIDDFLTSRYRLHDALYLCGGIVGNYAGMDVIAWDDVGYEWWMHWKTDIYYKSQLALYVSNADPVNPITFRARIRYSIARYP